jgi:hypothetical protein
MARFNRARSCLYEQQATFLRKRFLHQIRHHPSRCGRLRDGGVSIGRNDPLAYGYFVTKNERLTKELLEMKGVYLKNEVLNTRFFHDSQVECLAGHGAMLELPSGLLFGLPFLLTQTAPCTDERKEFVYGGAA